MAPLDTHSTQPRRHTPITHSHLHRPAGSWRRRRDELLHSPAIRPLLAITVFVLAVLACATYLS